MEDFGLLLERSGVPECEFRCAAEDEVPAESLDRACEARDCPWAKEPEDPETLHFYMRAINLLEAGCPVGRDEFSDDDWLVIARLKQERIRYQAEKAKEAQQDGQRDGANTADPPRGGWIRGGLRG